MYASELGLPMIDEVLALTEVEIDNINGIDLLDVIIVLSAVDIFRHQLGCSEEDALEIGILRLALNLDEQQFAVNVLSQNIYTVRLVIDVFFIALAL